MKEKLILLILINLSIRAFVYSQAVYYPYENLEFNNENLQQIRLDSNRNVSIRQDSKSYENAAFSYSDGSSLDNTFHFIEGFDGFEKRIRIDFSDIFHMSIESIKYSGSLFWKEVESISFRVTFVDADRIDIEDLAIISFGEFKRKYLISKIVTVDYYKKDLFLCLISDEAIVPFDYFEQGSLFEFFFTMHSGGFDVIPVWWASESIADSPGYRYKSHTEVD